MKVMYRLAAFIIFILLLPLTAQPQSCQFKFAVLTDLHLSPGNSGPKEDLQRSVDQLNRTDSIDFVLVTGDLTEVGDRSSLLQVKSILDQLKMKYYIIPGNHETKWSESGMTDFANIFGSERFKLEHKGFLLLGFNSGPLMRMAYGHVAPQDIRWMKEEMEKSGKGKQIILVTHYPIIPGDIDNWYEVTDAVRPYNVRMFIGGHYHRNRQLSYDGIPGILVRSNLRGQDKPGGYGIFKVDQDSIIIYEHSIGLPMQHWASLSLNRSYYDHKGKADQYPDFSVNRKYPQVKSEWIKDTGVGIYSSPVAYKNKVYVGDDMGYLKCYTLDNGEECWSFHTDKRIIGTPAADQNTIVFGSADKKIYGLDAQSGKERWKIEAKEPVLGAVAIHKGTAYIGGSDSVFRAIDLLNGTIKWEYRKIKGYIECKPLIVKDQIIFGAWDNTLYALRQKNGEEVWRWTGGMTRKHFSPAAVWPVSANGKVFIADPERALTAIDLANGQTIWRTYQSTVRESIGLSADRTRIYAKTMNDSIVCYSAKENRPVQIWASNIGFGYEHAPSMLIEKKGTLFGSTKEGLIFALEARTGKIKWIHKVGNSLINTVVPLSSCQLLFTSTDGKLGLLTWKESENL